MPRPEGRTSRSIFLRYSTRVPFFRYGLTKNHGGSPIALLAPYNGRTLGCRRVFQIPISRTNNFRGVDSARTLMATVRPRHVPLYTSEKKPIPIFSSRSTSNLYRIQGQQNAGQVGG